MCERTTYQDGQTSMYTATSCLSLLRDRLLVKDQVPGPRDSEMMAEGGKKKQDGGHIATNSWDLVVVVL